MTEPMSAERPLLPTLRRFLPYLWPKDSPALRLRIVGAMSLVVLSKLVQVYGAPFALQGAVDGMAKGDRSATTLIVALVVGYAAARFGSVLFDNLRNAVFERVGQDATRRLAATVFRHLHQLSLRFHLERRTGVVTKVVERGTKSIDTMLYFLLFNIAPTILELALVIGIFGTKFGGWLVTGTLVMVVVYIAFTRWSRSAACLLRWLTILAIIGINLAQGMGHSSVIQVKQPSKELDAAVNEARAELQPSLPAFQKPEDGDTAFALQARIVGSNNVVEHIWVNNLTYVDGHFEGTLA